MRADAGILEWGVLPRAPHRGPLRANDRDIGTSAETRIRRDARLSARRRPFRPVPSVRPRSPRNPREPDVAGFAGGNEDHTPSHHANFAMWAWMDRIGIVLFDASLSTAVFFTCIVLAMLACRQPARRILLARVAHPVVAGDPPLVGLGHLPATRHHRHVRRVAILPQGGVPVTGTLASRRRRRLSAAAPAVGGGDLDRAGRHGPSTGSPIAGRPSLRWFPRGLTLLDLACVAAGSAWLMLGVAGVYWLIGRSRPPSPATQALFDQLVAGRSGPAAGVALRVSSRLRHPVVTGLLRPTILIPEALDRAEPIPSRCG